MMQPSSPDPRLTQADSVFGEDVPAGIIQPHVQQQHTAPTAKMNAHKPKQLSISSNNSNINTINNNSSNTNHAAPLSTNPTPRSGRRGFFSSFWRSKKNNSGLTASNSASSSSATTAASSSSSSSTASPTAATSTASNSTVPPRRKWLHYPVRVPILALVLVSLLARTSEGWTSIGGFLCGFLLFEGFSAPDTGQPNRIETLFLYLLRRCRRCQKRRQKQQRKSKKYPPTGSNESTSCGILSTICSMILWIQIPFVWIVQKCLMRLRRKHATAAHNNTANASASSSTNQTPPSTADSNSSNQSAPPAAEEEDEDVLLDVAVSVTDDSAAATAPSSSTTGADIDQLGAGRQSPSLIQSSVTPLHPLSEIADEGLISEALPSLPTVTALDPSDAESPTPTGNTGNIVGGKAHFGNVSVSLKFTIYNFHIHLHHWVYLLIICFFLYMEQCYWPEHAATEPVYAFASAFCLGGSVQGLKYADWFRVIWRKTKETLERRNSLPGVGGSTNGNELTAAAAVHHSNGTHRRNSSPRIHVTSPHTPMTRRMDEMEMGGSNERQPLLLQEHMMDDTDGDELASNHDSDSERIPKLVPLARTFSAPSIALSNMEANT